MINPLIVFFASIFVGMILGWASVHWEWSVWVCWLTAVSLGVAVSSAVYVLMVK